jgi:hypothetical protein
MPEILYCDVAYRDYPDIIGDLISTKISNKEIYLLAMALGISNPTKIDGKRHTFVRHSYFYKNDINMIYTCAWRHLGKDVQSLLDEKSVYEIAENCANTGFRIIRKYLEENKHQFLKKLVLDTMAKFKTESPQEED